MRVDQFATFSIHVENLYASGKAQRPRGPRSSLTMVRPQINIQACALAFYIRHYIEPTEKQPLLATCVAESLLAWRKSSRHSTCRIVDGGLSSLALAVFARTQKSESAAAEASSAYHRLLGMTRGRIGTIGPDTHQSHVEACLLAVLMMGRYEGAMHHPGMIISPTRDSFMALRSWLHHDGALAILQMWNDYLSHSNKASCIIKHTRRGLTLSALLRGFPLADWLLDGERFGEVGLDLDYDRILVPVVNLRYTAKQLLEQGADADEHTIDELDAQAKSLDVMLEDFATKIPFPESRRRFYLLEQAKTWSWPRKHFFSPFVTMYKDQGYAALWALYFAARILVNSTRLKILRAHSHTPEANGSAAAHSEKRAECLTTIQLMVTELASVTPFVLDRVESTDPTARCGWSSLRVNIDEPVKPHLATLMVWPLSVAGSIEGVDVDRQRWFRSELSEVGRIVGDGILQCAETEHWAVL
ncbi:hypothetical protein PV08_06605 [Exophiala spinifera]|uniref:Transcription factor domain-containing protein n=1 Tax=Exophiala spinifera TaxID=91928 RepID=A0A0D2B545_9EURO|nr:uncharacterized protein PV08_06605 [Exophiala spinifera]KIW13825.1 hypothetical protein PV08_06605 [Exophiala spinifera]